MFRYLSIFAAVLLTQTYAVTIQVKVRAATEGSGSVSGDASDEYKMEPVVSIQARVESAPPLWDAPSNSYLSKYGSNSEEKYNATLDSVNTASVEGALIYVQAEGINADQQSVKCERKNNMSTIIFYEMTIAQPEYSMAKYGSEGTLEYCPYLTMDSAKCTGTDGGIEQACKELYGLDGELDLGPCIGSQEVLSDPRAPYSLGYWFSFPGSCAQDLRADKTPECREKYQGGLCPPGVKPDGETCTFSYKILGYLSIDDLVGITTDDTYKNFKEFCEAGNVEFSATDTGKGFTVKESLPFWENPGDQEANDVRTKTMVDKYNEAAAGPAPDGEGTMSPLPSLTELAEKNPPCYKNVEACATAANGCERVGYSQICVECDSASPSCVKAPAGFKFPKLEQASKSSTVDSESESGSSLSDIGSEDKSKSESGDNKNTDADKGGAFATQFASFFATSLAFIAYIIL